MILFFDTEARHFDRLRLAAEYMPFLPWDKVVQLWIEGGLLSLSSKIDGPESWSNVCVHSATASIVGYELSKLLGNGRFSVSVYEVSLALLVHDWNKKLEVDVIKSSRSVSAVSKFNLKNSHRVASLFGQRIANLSLCTGDLGYDRFSKHGFGLEEFIIFYADACTSGNRVVGYEQRFEALKADFHPRGKYGHTDFYFRKTYGKSWMDCNLEVVNQMEMLFKSSGLFVNSQKLRDLLPNWCF